MNETKKKRRTLEEQIADKKRGESEELASLLAREQAVLASKAAQKKRWADAAGHFKRGLELAMWHMPLRQPELPEGEDVAVDESPLG